MLVWDSELHQKLLIRGFFFALAEAVLRLRSRG